MADKMQDTYKAVELLPNERKAFRDQEVASFWGCDLDGRAGLLRGSLKRAVPLAGLLLEVVQIGVATPESSRDLSFLFSYFGGDFWHFWILFSELQRKARRASFCLECRSQRDAAHRFCAATYVRFKLAGRGEQSTCCVRRFKLGRSWSGQ